MRKAKAFRLLILFLMVTWLDAAVDKGYTDTARIKRDPLLESIRTDPRFQTLLQHMDAKIQEMQKE